MNILNNENSWKDEENLNWDAIKISKIDNQMIKKLINYFLKIEISDGFFISVDSLIKLGKKAEKSIESAILDANIKEEYKKNLLELILYYIVEKKLDDYLVFKLYNPDFIVRARIIMQINHKSELDQYINFILPLLNDPDDSVRWAVLDLLINHDLVMDPSIRKKLHARCKKEMNGVIKKKILKIL